MTDDNIETAQPDPARLDAFIARWQGAGGSERANYQLFVTELARLLGLPEPPRPATTAAMPWRCYAAFPALAQPWPSGHANWGLPR